MRLSTAALALFTLALAASIGKTQGKKVMILYDGAYPRGKPSIPPSEIPSDPNGIVDVYVALSFFRDSEHDGYFTFWQGGTLSAEQAGQGVAAGKRIMLALAGGDSWAWSDPADRGSWVSRAVESLDAALDSYQAEAIDLNYEISDNWSGFSEAMCDVASQLKQRRPSLVLSISPYSATMDVYGSLYSACGQHFDLINYQLYEPLSSVTEADMDTYLGAAASEIDSVKSAFGLNDESKLVLGMCTTIGDRRGTPDDEKSVAIVKAHPGAAGVFVWTAEESAEAGYSLEKKVFEVYSSLDGSDGGGSNDDGSSDSDCTYTVKPGDTLSKIADAKGTTTEAIESLNPGVDSLNLQIGQTINLSCGNGDDSSDCTYTVKPGDTLSKIADAKGTTTDAIESLNPGVDPLNLQIGQTINLPCGNGDDSSDCTYTVKPGDTLSKIADAKGTSTDAIESLNPGVDPLNLQIGQVISIPCNGLRRRLGRRMLY